MVKLLLDLVTIATFTYVSKNNYLLYLLIIDNRHNVDIT